MQLQKRCCVIMYASVVKIDLFISLLLQFVLNTKDKAIWNPALLSAAYSNITRLCDQSKNLQQSKQYYKLIIDAAKSRSETLFGILFNTEDQRVNQHIKGSICMHALF